MALEAAIFDMDGVVVNTVPVHFKAWQKMFSEEGVEFTFEDYKEKVDGIPRMDGARAILSNYSQGQLKAAGDRKQSYFLELLEREPIPVYETTIAFMRRLKEESIKVAVISSSKNCRGILEQIKVINLLDALVDGHEITKGKPDPQVFLMAAERLKVLPANCIAFEDAVLGVEAVKCAGMVCVGIDRYGNPKRLARADVVIGDVGQLPFKRVRTLLS